MKIIACVDNNNGLLFNHRRLSKDRNVILDIENMTKENKFTCSEYSSHLFLNSDLKNFTVKNELPQSGYFFVEDILPKDLKNVDEIILYQWNREYPSDLKFEIDPKKYNEVDRKEFTGYSHEKITKIVLKRS